MKDFCKRWCLEREDYYGGKVEKSELRGQFAGNKCAKLLNHVTGDDSLEYYLRKNQEAFNRLLCDDDEMVGITHGKKKAL